jgi:hypothetical protein
VDRIQANFTRIANLDVQRLKVPISGGPPKHVSHPQEASRLSSLLSVASRVSSTAGMLKEIVDIANLMRAIPVNLIGAKGAMFSPPPNTGIMTIGAGSSGSIFSIVGVTVGQGIYASNSPEFGFYHGIGGGYWTNVGVSGGIQLTYVMGPPSDFGGLSWAVGVDCDIPGVGMGLSAAVLFSASGPPYQLQGWCVGIGAGVSALPVSLSFQVSNTKLIPLVKP